MTYPYDFVDREEEILLFKETLARKRNMRVLIFLIESQHGKTYLMSFLKDFCRSKRRRVTLIDFDQRGKDPVSYWKFVSDIRDDLGDKLFKNVNACEKRHRGALPLVNYRPESGGGGITLGKKGRVDESKLQDWTGRDKNVFFTSFSGSTDNDADREKRQRDEMGRAFMSDLSKLCQDKPVVLLLDTYEQASRETRRWLDEWLFSRLQDRYPGLVIVIAGQPKMRDYLVHSQSWKSLMHVHERFSSPQEKHIREYLEKSNLQISGEKLESFLVAASFKMGVMAQLRDAFQAKTYRDSRNESDE